MTRATRVVLFKKVKSVGEMGLDKLSASDESVSEFTGVSRSSKQQEGAGRIWQAQQGWAVLGVWEQQKTEGARLPQGTHYKMVDGFCSLGSWGIFYEL